MNSNTFRQSVKKSILLASTMLVLAGCGAGAKQTPLALQEPFKKKDFNIRHAEDKITLRLRPGVTHLSSEQRDYIHRFVKYYDNSEDTAFYISLLIAPEHEDIGKLPRHKPYIPQQVAVVAEALMEMGIKPKFMKQVDLAEDDAYIQARASKQIIDNTVVNPVPSDEGLAELAPNPAHLTPDTKISIIVREYEIEAANCPQTGYHDWQLANIHTTNGITTGCSVNEALLAQIQDKTVLVEGEAMDPTFNSAFDVLRIREVQEGKFSPDFDQLNSQQLQFVQGSTN